MTVKDEYTDENYVDTKESILNDENPIVDEINNINKDVNKVIDNENGINSDTDYIPNIDGYSTDDSLPLEIKRKKLKKDKFESIDNLKLETKWKKIKKREKNKKDPEKVEPKIDRRRRPFLNDDLNETLFTITDLSFDEQIADIEKRRESANYKNSRFKCTLCYKGFLDEEAYNGHMSRHTVVSILPVFI